MPSSWLTIDANFPSFRGDETPQQQISELYDYMVVLTEQLRYQLSNLSVKNWNSTALQDFQNETTEGVNSELTAITAQLSQISSELANVTSRVSDVERLVSRMTAAETAISELEIGQEAAREDIDALTDQLGNAQADIDTLQQDADELRNTVTGEGGLSERVDALEEAASKLEGIPDSVQKTDSGVSLGGEGQEVHLTGKVYINGVLIE